MIICFSGTGNTLSVARQLSGLLTGENIVMLEGDTLLRPENFSLTPAPRNIIWAFPTYSWGMPPVVARFIRQIPSNPAFDSAVHWMLTTCGDDIGMTDRRWRRIIRSRGWKAADAFSVIMPNTYTLMKGFDVDDENTAARKLNAMPEQVKAIAARISDAGAAPLPLLVRGAWPRIKSSVIRPLFERFAMSPAPFHVNGGCTGCGLCARSCPMNNISMLSTDNDATARPHRGKNCALCLRCYHICPRRAVAYGRHATDGKGQWINPVLMKKTT